MAVAGSAKRRDNGQGRGRPPRQQGASRGQRARNTKARRKQLLWPTNVGRSPNNS